MHTDNGAAVQFFLNEHMHAAEAALYSDSALHGVTPVARERYTNADGLICDASGHALPPFMVIDRGEPLRSFLARAETERITVVHTLVFVVKCLRALHAAGLVHGDLSPENIVRLEATHSWAVIDFGCAAPQGALLCCPRCSTQLGRDRLWLRRAAGCALVPCRCWENVRDLQSLASDQIPSLQELLCCAVCVASDTVFVSPVLLQRMDLIRNKQL